MSSNRTNPGPLKADAYTAGDYAGICGGKWRFYYGYEEAIGRTDDDEGVWCFVAWKDGTEVVRWPCNAKHKMYDCEDMLMKGLARFMAEGRFDQ